MKNPFRQSTPEASEIHGMLAEMISNGKQYAVVEATSHGLSRKTNRLGDVLFDAAVLTNVTHEHLEFHGSFEQYRSDKANLFRAVSRSADKAFTCPRFGVANVTDASFGYFKTASSVPVLSYGTGTVADLSAQGAAPSLRGCDFVLEYRGRKKNARISIPGPLFWVDNVLAAVLTVATILEADPLELVPFLPGLCPVKGRMDGVDLGQKFRVIVDYAHTPAAFERLLPWMREHTEGRLIAVFGSAGERDRQKRPMQGEVASRYCDVLVLTDEDPRGEDSVAILEEIAAGSRGKQRGSSLLLIPDRPQAIRRAFSIAAPGDTVLLLGKGHEASIIHASGPRRYDERSEAEAALRELGLAREIDRSPHL